MSHGGRDGSYTSILTLSDEDFTFFHTCYALTMALVLVSTLGVFIADLAGVRPVERVFVVSWYVGCITMIVFAWKLAVVSGTDITYSRYTARIDRLPSINRWNSVRSVCKDLFLILIIGRVALSIGRSAW